MAKPPRLKKPTGKTDQANIISDKADLARRDKRIRKAVLAALDDGKLLNQSALLDAVGGMYKYDVPTLRAMERERLVICWRNGSGINLRYAAPHSELAVDWPSLTDEEIVERQSYLSLKHKERFRADPVEAERLRLEKETKKQERMRQRAIHDEQAGILRSPGGQLLPGSKGIGGGVAKKSSTRGGLFTLVENLVELLRQDDALEHLLAFRNASPGEFYRVAASLLPQSVVIANLNTVAQPPTREELMARITGMLPDLQRLPQTFDHSPDRDEPATVVEMGLPISSEDDYRDELKSARPPKQKTMEQHQREGDQT